MTIPTYRTGTRTEAMMATGDVDLRIEIKLLPTHSLRHARKLCPYLYPCRRCCQIWQSHSGALSLGLAGSLCTELHMPVDVLVLGPSTYKTHPLLIAPS